MFHINELKNNPDTAKVLIMEAPDTIGFTARSLINMLLVEVRESEYDYYSVSQFLLI